MKKKPRILARELSQAYTLAEVLITLVIVAIIAAVLAPIASKLRPDSRKITYLKSYDALVNAVQKAASNSSIYGPYYKAGNDRVYDTKHYPLMNTNRPANPAFNDNKYTAGNKLGNVIKDLLGGDGSYDTGFITKNGVAWTISESNTVINGSNASFRGEVAMYLDGIGSSCQYGESGCTKPGKFTFVITPSGDVVATDGMGRAYLETRKEFLKREENPLENINVANVEGCTINVEEITPPTNDEQAAELLVSSDCDDPTSDCYCDKHYGADSCKTPDPCEENPQGYRCAQWCEGGGGYDTDTAYCCENKGFKADKCCSIEPYKTDNQSCWVACPEKKCSGTNINYGLYEPNCKTECPVVPCNTLNCTKNGKTKDINSGLNEPNCKTDCPTLCKSLTCQYTNVNANRYTDDEGGCYTSCYQVHCPKKMCGGRDVNEDYYYQPDGCWTTCPSTPGGGGSNDGGGSNGGGSNGGGSSSSSSSSSSSGGGGVDDRWPSEMDSANDIFSGSCTMTNYSGPAVYCGDYPCYWLDRSVAVYQGQGNSNNCWYNIYTNYGCFTWCWESSNFSGNIGPITSSIID